MKSLPFNLQAIARGIRREARARFDYPTVTVERCQRRFEQVKSEHGKLHRVLEANLRRLLEHQNWLGLENSRADTTSYGTIRARAESRLPKILACIDELGRANTAARQLAIKSNRTLLDVQIVIKSPISGLKTLNDKVSALELRLTQSLEKFEVIRRQTQALIEGEEDWQSIESANLQLTSGFESLGLETLLLNAYGPMRSIAVRVQALTNLGSWAKSKGLLEPETTFETHRDMAKSLGNIESAEFATTITAALAESSASGVLSPRVFFAICHIEDVGSQELRRDLCFAFSNSVQKVGSTLQRPDAVEALQLAWLNEALDCSGLEPVSLKGHSGSLIDRLHCASKTARMDAPTALVSVIVPVHNAGAWLSTALDSLTSQTHSNLEIIVVDDASEDNSREVALAHQKTDNRIRVVANETNLGVYASRNKALRVATGEYVTVHDADDWSHPAKIELQVSALQANRALVATTSEAIRVTSEGFQILSPRGGDYLRANFSSLMFRRLPVMEALGFWDEVRFGADSEFQSRISTYFGVDAVLALATGPVSLTRSWSGSLTAGGIDQPLSGTRKVYRDSFQRWHQQNKGDPGLLKLIPGEPRKFFAPRACLGDASQRFESRVVLVADFSSSGSGLNILKSESTLLSADPGALTLVHIPSPNDPNGIPSDEVERLCLNRGFWPAWWLEAEFGSKLELSASAIVAASSACQEKFERLPSITSTQRVLLLENENHAREVGQSKTLWVFESMFGGVTTLVAPSVFSAKSIERELPDPISVRASIAAALGGSATTKPVGDSQSASLG